MTVPEDRPDAILDRHRESAPMDVWRDLKSLAAQLADAQARLGRLEKTHAGDHRGFVESRRSICEQSDRYKARAEAAEALVAALSVAPQPQPASERAKNERFEKMVQANAKAWADQYFGPASGDQS